VILKWLILGVIVYVVYIAFFKSKSVQNSKGSFDKKDDDSEDLVECSECGTFVAKHEAFIKNGKFYCSKECMLKG